MRNGDCRVQKISKNIEKYLDRPTRGREVPHASVVSRPELKEDLLEF